ncbi:MAG: hypothetical protein LBT92_00445 [Rickettsiales bacterium]|jgi:hypothetical protein|nr:hypothetical protein [Rickettsiales bacterium]
MASGWKDKVVRNPTGMGACSDCCFRNYRPICKKMECIDEAGSRYYWTTKDGMEIDVSDFVDLARGCR